MTTFFIETASLAPVGGCGKAKSSTHRTSPHSRLLPTHDLRSDQRMSHTRIRKAQRSLHVRIHEINQCAWLRLVLHGPSGQSHRLSAHVAPRRAKQPEPSRHYLCPIQIVKLLRIIRRFVPRPPFFGCNLIADSETKEHTLHQLIKKAFCRIPKDALLGFRGRLDAPGHFS